MHKRICLPVSRVVTEIVGCILSVGNIIIILLVDTETESLVDNLMEWLGSTETDMSLTRPIILEGDGNGTSVDIAILLDDCIILDITDKSGELVDTDLL